MREVEGEEAKAWRRMNNLDPASQKVKLMVLPDGVAVVLMKKKLEDLKLGFRLFQSCNYYIDPP